MEEKVQEYLPIQLTLSRCGSDLLFYTLSVWQEEADHLDDGGGELFR